MLDVIFDFLINTKGGLMLTSWATFNFLKFVIAKDELDDADQAFPVWKYVRKSWDNWILNLFVGLLALGLTGKVDVSSAGLEFVDLWYIAPGPTAEYLLDFYKGWRKKQRTKSAE